MISGHSYKNPGWIGVLTVAGGGGGPAVAFDAKFEKGSASQASPFSYVSNAGTVAGTVGATSSTNLVLIVAAEFAQTGISAVSVVWDFGGSAQTMTPIGSALTAGGRMVFIFGLIAPTTGAKTIRCTWTGGSATIVLGGVSYYNADQSTGWTDRGTDTGTSTSASSAVTSEDGRAVFVAHCNNNASSTTLSAGTAAWTDTAFDGNYGGAYRLSTGTSTTVTWTLGSSVAWGNAKVDIIKA